MNESKATLYGKMAQVMGQLNRIKETGTHHQGWRYATSEDVKDAVRAAMSDAGLALLVSLEDHEIINLDKGIMVRGKMAFTLCCSETGATETRHLWGEAADQTKVSDKAFYKLYTTLEKYFLKTTFLISSGGELDSDADGPQQAQQQHNNSYPEPKTPEPKTPWPATIDDFIASVQLLPQFETWSDEDIKKSLKQLGFKTYSRSIAPKMLEALVKAKVQALADAKNEPMPQAQAVEAARTVMDEVEADAQPVAGDLTSDELADMMAEDAQAASGLALPDTDAAANLT